MKRTAVYSTAARQRSSMGSRTPERASAALITPARSLCALVPNRKLTAHVWYLDVTCRRHTARIELHGCVHRRNRGDARAQCRGARRLSVEGDTSTVRYKSHLEAEPAANTQGNGNWHEFDYIINPHLSCVCMRMVFLGPMASSKNENIWGWYRSFVGIVCSYVMPI